MSLVELVKPDKTKPARLLRKPETNEIVLEYTGVDGNVYRVPIALFFLPQEFGDLAAQLTLADLVEMLRVRISESSIMVPVDVQGSYIMVPVDIQDQVKALLVRFVAEMLATSASTTIEAGATGSISMTVPSGQIWEVQFTNHVGSGPDISLTLIEVSPNGGTTFIPVSTSHLVNANLIVTAGNVVRATFSNAGASAETAVLNVVGRRLVA